jgi:UDPglucose--hexose-1-phosphate uridylyltransferase
MKRKQIISELRQDLVSGDWIVVAPRRAHRPRPDDLQEKKREKSAPKSACPFENPQKSGHGLPLLMLDRKGNEVSYALRTTHDALKKPDWFLQVVPNKFPAVAEGNCSIKHRAGPFSFLEGAGFHEVVIYRDHDRQLSSFTAKELELMIFAFQRRYQALAAEDCVEYILVFHNQGAEAGASIYHPHSQIIALPVIPPDVASSITGSKNYFRRHHRCVHCDMIAFERKAKKRVVYENSEMIAFCPFASRVSFEVRIFPKKHENAFELIDVEQRTFLSRALSRVLRKLSKGVFSYNFFIHTSPTHPQHFKHYHWHMEILPRTSTWAGVELGTGIEVVSVPPEKAAAYLRRL